MTDTGFVYERRAQGVGWQALARMLGKPELDLRRRYDPSYESPYSAALPKRVAPTARPAPLPLPKASDEPRSRQHQVMRLLYAAHPHFVGMPRLGGHTGANAVACLRGRHGHHVIESLQGSGYRLTKAGLEIYREHYAEDRTP